MCSVCESADGLEACRSASDSASPSVAAATKSQTGLSAGAKAGIAVRDSTGVVTGSQQPASCTAWLHCGTWPMDLPRPRGSASLAVRTDFATRRASWPTVSPSQAQADAAQGRHLVPEPHSAHSWPVGRVYWTHDCPLRLEIIMGTTRGIKRGISPAQLYEDRSRIGLYWVRVVGGCTGPHRHRVPVIAYFLRQRSDSRAAGVAFATQAAAQEPSQRRLAARHHREAQVQAACDRVCDASRPLTSEALYSPIARCTNAYSCSCAGARPTHRSGAARN